METERRTIPRVSASITMASGLGNSVRWTWESASSNAKVAPDGRYIRFQRGDSTQTCSVLPISRFNSSKENKQPECARNEPRYNRFDTKRLRTCLMNELVGCQILNSASLPSIV